MLYAVISTLLLQLAVVYIPFLQFTFETYPLRLPELLGSVAIASLMLFGVEIEKLVMNQLRPQTA
jgi:Ca2+-transporting ATPase